MTSRRMERVNTLLRTEISRAIAQEVKDPRLSSMVSVLRVDTAPDLNNAQVYISVLGDDQEKKRVMRALRSASEYIRHTARGNLELRTVPHMNFVLDESIEHAVKMNRLIDKAAVRKRQPAAAPTDDKTPHGE